MSSRPALATSQDPISGEKVKKDSEYSLVVWHVPSRCKAPNARPRTEKQKLPLVTERTYRCLQMEVSTFPAHPLIGHTCCVWVWKMVV